MSLVNIITENIILPVSDILTGKTISKNLSFLMKSQYWSREQLDEYQEKKLRELIRHSYKYVPFYYELMNKYGLKPSDINTKSDLQKLPIVTKVQLRKENWKHLATNLKANSYIKHSSSGSTGEPFQFHILKNAESFNKAANIRAWYWYGYRLGNRYVKISMNPRQSRVKKVQDFINNCEYLSSNQLIDKNFKLMADRIIAFDPIVIRGYPIPLLYLAETISTHYGEYKGKSLSSINSTGSTLNKDARQKIEKVFNVKIFDSYSCEGGANFTECPLCGYYHPSEEYAISEFIEDDYTISDPDQPYRHITTDLMNYASPFIRYDSQDYIVLKNNSKDIQCKHPYMQIKRIKGRDSDILITPSGKYLIVENFVAYFEYISEIDLIQVIQNEIDQIDINLVVNSGFNAVRNNQIYEYWQKYIGDDVRLSINIVDEIKLTPTGKRRTVIRNPEIRLYG